MSDSGTTKLSAEDHASIALVRIARKRVRRDIARMRHAWCAGRGHSWDYDERNSAKRTCSRCGRHEWMFTSRFPSETEPSIKWEHMPSGDRP